MHQGARGSIRLTVSMQRAGRTWLDAVAKELGIDADVDARHNLAAAVQSTWLGLQLAKLVPSHG